MRSLFHGNDSDGEYEAWDRFGRTLFQRWYKYSATTAYLDEWDYTYDYAGNRLERDLKPTEVSGAPTDHDQLFSYDGLHRLKTYDEGQISGGAISSPTDEQDFTLDQLGNWSNLLEKTGGSTTLDQDRAHNKVNEIDDDDTHGDADPSITGTPNWDDPIYDAAGNMTTMPVPYGPSDSFTAIYDAWNRLVEVKLGEDRVLSNEYDGFHQRIAKDVAEADTFDYYYNDKWQVIVETQEGTDESLYAWHPYYVDALAVRFRANDRHAFLHDDNFNVVAAYDIESGSGTFRQVVERYQYTPYGEVTYLEPDFDVAGVSSVISNNYLYTGRERDGETELQLNRRRFLHPPLGRWTTRDPIGYEGETLNLYEYVKSSPVNATDAMGLKDYPVPPYPGAPAPLPDPCQAYERRIFIDRTICASKLLGTAEDALPNYSSMPFQHCVWNCRMTRKHGRRYAVERSAQKEQCDVLVCKLARRMPKECWDKSPNQAYYAAVCCSADQASDWEDNAFGRDCGMKCGKKKDCEDCCRSGGLTPNTPDGPGTARPCGPWMPPEWNKLLPPNGLY